MTTRRSHNKTRLGCHQCKRRRIKCDVKHPSCANCDKKGETCSFLMLAPSSLLSTRSTSPTSSQLSALTSPPSPNGSSQPHSMHSPNNLTAFSNQIALATQTPRQTEADFEITPLDLSTGSGASPAQLYFSDIIIPPYLRLNDVWKDIREVLPPSLQEVLSHYEYTTSLSRASDDPAKAAWQTCVPEMAHQHEFLVNCVLSVASLHLGRLREDQAEKRKMNAIAASRMNKALTKYRSALENINQDNAAALFASSTLTAVYLFRTSQLDIQNLRASVPSDTVVPPPDVVDKMMMCALRSIWGLRGPLSVLMSGWNFVMSGKMHPVAHREWWPTSFIPATPQAVDEDERLRRIEALWTRSDRSWAPGHIHLSQALSILRETFNLISQLTLPAKYPPMTAVPYSVDDTTVGLLTDRGAIFVWATRISREFIQLVEKKDRDALVILAHYAILPGRVRNVWWLEGLGADFVTAIAMALGKENWSLIAWPASVVGVELENAFGARQDRLEGTPDEMHMAVI